MDNTKRYERLLERYMNGDLERRKFLGLIGAAIYYISVATSFWIGVLGLLKAIIWPVFFVYEALKFLGA